ncbi:Late transcription factor VLTF-4 (1), partial [Monkeypox virus]|jgi:hypothetical protein
MAWS